MTVPATTRRAGPFPGNGTATSFPFTFKTTNADEVQVVLRSAGVESQLVKDSDFTVTLNADQDSTPGGSITYPVTGAPLTELQTLTIAGAVPYSQEASLPDGGAYRAATVEQAFDRIVIQVQQLAEAIGRTVTVPLSAAGISTQLPVPDPGKPLGWNNAADALVNLDPSTLAAVIAYSNRRTLVADGGLASYTLAADPGNAANCLVVVSGVVKTPGVDYTVSGTVLTPVAPWPAGTGNVVITYGEVLPAGATAGIVHAQTEGADVAGDVTAVLSTAMDKALALGAEFHLTGGRTYQVTAFNPPAGLVVRTNGAIIQPTSTTTSNSSLVTVGALCSIDQLVVKIPAGFRRDRAIRLNGAGASIDRVKLTSVDQQANNSDTDDVGLTILADDISIGHCYIDGFDRALKINGQRVRIGNLDQYRFVRGCYIVDCAELEIRGGTAGSLSPNATLSPGNNAFLIGCNTVGASRDITISDYLVLAAGEHGIRLAGPESSRNVRFIRPTVRGVGACGIKIRGSDGVTSIYNYNVVIDSPIIEDCGTSPSAYLNRCGILAEWCAGVTVRNPIIRPRDTSYCASIGMRFNACNDIVVTGGQVHGADRDNVMLHADEADISRAMISGLITFNAAQDNLVLQVENTRTARNIHAVGAGVFGATRNGLYVNLVAGGVISDAQLGIRANGNGAAVVCNSAAVGLDVTGVPGTNPMASVSALNSSQWRDGTNTYIRKAGAWTAL